ncbi:MAG: RluA family pseudouridine synthase [Patescibacteria group bacterium]
MKPIVHQFIANQSSRLDKIITINIHNLSRGYIAALIKSGHARINQKIIYKPSHQVKIGDQIHIQIPPPQELTLQAQKADLDIIYENNDILVINKPAGIAVHPGPGHLHNTLVNILLYHYPDFKNFDPINNIYRPGIVHRLDKDTSGLLVIAKNQASLNQLQSDIKNQKWTKKYYALVLNNQYQSRGVIRKNITRSHSDRKKFATTMTKQGKTAITRYQTMQNFSFHGDNLSLVDVQIETGRTHQIRVHLLSENMPVIGDQTYYTKTSSKISKLLKIKRQLLHAYSLKIINPSSRRKKNLISELPTDFSEIINSIKTR